MTQKILINLSFVFEKPTGISNYGINLISYLKSLNPTLLTSKDIAGFNCYSIPANLTPAQGSQGHLRRLLWTQFKLPYLYQKLETSLLFSPIPEAPLYHECRYIVMVHDLIPLRFPRVNSPLTPYFRYYIPQVLTQAEHIICNSEATAKDITNFWQIPAKKITPILLGYDNQNFCQRDRAQDKINEQVPYFIYLGRHDPYKNLPRLIDAFAAMVNCRDYQLWLVGSPDRRYTPKLQAQVETLGLQEQVKFLNYVPYEELPIILNRALALVFPSLWEGFGLPVLEAMGCGTPVITSNLSSLPEVAGEAALLIDPYQTSAITAAMQTIAEDGKLRSHLSHLSLERASQFSWAKTGELTRKLLELYI